VVYDFFSHINCDFHEENENIYCALAVTKRLCYLFFDSLFLFKSKDLDINRTDNHKPVKQKVEVPEVTILKFSETRSGYRGGDRYHSNAFNSNSQTVGSDSFGITAIHNNSVRKPVGIGRGKMRTNFKK
jgi:hypothetical protein